MKAETLRAEITSELQSLAWGQWSQLGVSGARPKQREERAADPEALILFTLEVGRTDPRLFDEVLDWLVGNEQLVSVHRLRSLCVGATERALVEAALAWSAKSRGRARTATRQSDAQGDSVEPLFPSLPGPRGDVDPAFLAHGFLREPLVPSGKSQSPRLGEPICFAFRLRRLLGVGVRAEVIRTLLTVRAERISGKVVTASAGFAQRNVREGLAQLVDAGVISAVSVSDDRHYSTEVGDWSTLLGFESPRELPLHYEWIRAYRALAQILRWVQQPGLDELSPYLRASHARTLVEEIEADLRYVGIPHRVSSALGESFWDEFVEIARVAIRDAKR